jgi:hypothetical protein
MLIAGSENQDCYLGRLADTLIRKRSPGQGGPPYASMPLWWGQRPWELRARQRPTSKPNRGKHFLDVLPGLSDARRRDARGHGHQIRGR